MAKQEAAREVESAVLHSAVMLGGKTEATLNQVKTKGIILEWVNGEGLLAKLNRQECLIPEANVKAVYFKLK